jgi:hypothetical protein
MGCKWACVCGGFCSDCPEFEPEAYVGEAEDIYDGTHKRQPSCEPPIDVYIDEYINQNIQTKE